MKTNITLLSSDRNLFGTIVKQDTKTSFLSLTDLQEAYTVQRVKEGWSDRRIERIMATNDLAERSYYVLEKQGVIKATFCAFMEEVKRTSLVKVLKKYKAYTTKGARENRTVMCNPYIWVMIALEMNPKIYAEVVTWLTDKLILNRIEAGDNYNRLCRSAVKFPNVNYVQIAKGLNYIVFNLHETQYRDKATQAQLKELDELQTSLAFAVDMGYIKSYEELYRTMTKLYFEKWGNHSKYTELKSV